MTNRFAPAAAAIFASLAVITLTAGCAARTATEVPAESGPQTDGAAAEPGGDEVEIETGAEPKDNGDAAISEPAPDGEADFVRTPEAAEPTGDVRWIQRRLRDLGYYSGPVDGDAGGATRRAIREYQADQDLPVTGRPTAELQDFMWRNDG